MTTLLLLALIGAALAAGYLSLPDRARAALRLQRGRHAAAPGQPTVLRATHPLRRAR